VHGALVEAGTDRCVVEVDGAREVVPYSDVTSAHTVFEWGPQPRPGSTKGAKPKGSNARARAGAKERS
jgi:hypothetical protein